MCCRVLGTWHKPMACNCVYLHTLQTMDKSQRSNSWTGSMWKTVQRYAAALVPQQQDDFLPLTNQQAEQLVTQQSRSRQELLNDMGESLLTFLRLGPS